MASEPVAWWIVGILFFIVLAIAGFALRVMYAGLQKRLERLETMLGRILDFISAQAEQNKDFEKIWKRIENMKDDNAKMLGDMKLENWKMFDDMKLENSRLFDEVWGELGQHDKKYENLLTEVNNMKLTHVACVNKK